MKIIVFSLIVVVLLSLFLVGCTPNPVPLAVIELCKERNGWPKYHSDGRTVSFECLEKEVSK